MCQIHAEIAPNTFLPATLSPTPAYAVKKRILIEIHTPSNIQCSLGTKATSDHPYSEFLRLPRLSRPLVPYYNAQVAVGLVVILIAAALFQARLVAQRWRAFLVNTRIGTGQRAKHAGGGIMHTCSCRAAHLLALYLRQSRRALLYSYLSTQGGTSAFGAIRITGTRLTSMCRTRIARPC